MIKSMTYHIPIPLVFALSIILSCCSSRQNNSIFSSEELKQIERINSSLPRPIGTVGILNRITVNSDTVIYHQTAFGDESLSEIYRENDSIIPQLMLLSLFLLNDELSNNGLYKLMKERDAKIAISLQVSNGSLFVWTIDKETVKTSIHDLKMRPEEALKSIIDIHVALMNNNIGVQSAIINSVDDGISIDSIRREGNRIVMSYKTDSSESEIEESQSAFNDNELRNTYLREIQSDPDMREFLILFALSKTDFTYRMKSKNGKKSAEITFPADRLTTYATNFMDL